MAQTQVIELAPPKRRKTRTFLKSLGKFLVSSGLSPMQSLLLIPLLLTRLGLLLPLDCACSPGSPRLDEEDRKPSVMAKHAARQATPSLIIRVILTLSR